MSVVDKVANVVGAKTARPCDGCIRKRARWFCAADDAFLCQSCDSRVHSANPLARRHERVRLKTASFGSQRGADNVIKSEAPRPSRVPSWHSRKARTQRGKQQCSSSSKSPTSDDIVKNLFYLVPEDDVSDETKSFDEIDGLLLYGRVPIFDSFMVDMCTSPRRANKSADGGNPCFGANEMKGFVGSFYSEVGFVPSEIDLEEFAADVESMLGKVLDDDESFGIDGLGLIMDDSISTRCGGRVIKDEDEETKAEEIEMANDAFHNLSFDYDEDCSDEKAVMKKRKIMLSLDYESILSAWDGPSPWASGTVPEVDPTECWPACSDTCEIESHQQHLVDHPACINGGTGLSGDEGRKARVSRYREKRRTRLFSKKIRYEVRKLNAEKRPRMKGRFVKRPLSSFPPTSSISLFS